MPQWGGAFNTITGIMRNNIFYIMTLAALTVLPMSVSAKSKKKVKAKAAVEVVKPDPMERADTTFVAQGNPIVKYEHIGDPAAMVYDNTLYIYGGVDEAPFPEQRYVMNRWTVLSTKDMKTFTEYKCPLSVKDFTWCRGDAWAAQVIERNGKFYWYVTVENNAENHGKCLAVAVADSPVGPFKDAIGKPLVTHQDTGEPRPHMSWDDIDPTVFIDANGQAYIYWGNTRCYWAKLKDNMIELDGGIHEAEFTNSMPFNPISNCKDGEYYISNNVNYGQKDPGENSGWKAGFTYTEAPWLHKQGDWYYLSFAVGWPEKLAYAMSKSPEGPWEYKGILNEISGNSNTNHHGIFEFNGQWYVVYHNGALPDGSGYRRSVCLDRIFYNADGTIQKMKMTSEGVQ